MPITEKPYFDYIFIILTYRNVTDVEECLVSLAQNFSNYKVLIVNSYYDELTKAKFFKISQENVCDFLNIENKGYGYGNNRGIEYCRQNYEFQFLVISNPDIIVRENQFVPQAYLGKPVVIAPNIITLSGKWQNPYWDKKLPVAEFLIYAGYKYRKKSIIYCGIAMHKILREFGNRLFFAKTGRTVKKVYAAHGSFMLFSKEAIMLLGNVYDENMFLFAEESYLAHKLEEKNIPVIFTKQIKISHKEDGSIRVSDINEKNEARKSIVYYYEKVNRSK